MIWSRVFIFPPFEIRTGYPQISQITQRLDYEQEYPYDTQRINQPS